MPKLPWTMQTINCKLFLTIPKPLHDTPLRVLYKVDYLVALNSWVKFGLDDIKGFGHVIFFKEDNTVNFLYLVNGSCRKTPAAQTNRIDADI